MYVVRVDDVLLMSEMRRCRASAAFLRGFGISRFGMLWHVASRCEGLRPQAPKPGTPNDRGSESLELHHMGSSPLLGFRV